jgi:pilus assembly protein CpaB
MTPKRTVVVAVAIAVGVVASVLSYVFLNDAQQRAFHNAKMVPAYVIAKPVPRTLSAALAISDGYIVQKNVPSEFRPPSAVTDLAALKGTEAVAPFSTGQVLVSSMFVSPTAAANTFSGQIPPGDVAVTVSVDQVHGVAGLAVPGDKVDILISEGATESFMLQNVPIMAIGQSTSANASSSSPNATTTASTGSSNLYTFSVTPADAQRIALAQQQNLGIYLVLVPPGSPVVSVPGADLGSILNGPQSSS